MTAAASADGDLGDTLLWTTELTVPGGQGQVVVNGAHALLPPPGPGQLHLPVRRGPNRVEAVLVSGDGEGGLWRFSLASGRVQGGSLRAIAGEAVALGPGMVAFGLHGVPGERVVFTFDVD